MDWNAETIKTYDDSAQALAAYFKGVGPRVEYIERGLQLAGKTDKTARVVEIGCGDGRDAAEIIPRVAWYEGFDPSKGLLALARKKLPTASFVWADALTYAYPKNLDVIYAFASLLHIDRSSLGEVFKKAVDSLRSGGILYMSLKERSEYTEEVREDEYGKRMFYYYNAAIIQDIVGNTLTLVHEGHEKTALADWLVLAFKKN